MPKPEPENLDLAEFESQVLSTVGLLAGLVSSIDLRNRARRGAMFPERSDNNSLWGRLINRFVAAGSVLAEGMAKQYHIEEWTAYTRKFLLMSETREFLCPALIKVGENLSRLNHRSTERDATEIAATLTPILVSSIQAKVVDLPLEPLLFAIMAWLLARTTPAIYCSGVHVGRS
jgi:hypothetical protein